MAYLALALAGLAAVVHVYIFVLESSRWEQPKTRGVFGMSADQAAATKEMAYNQGFYNLFLALSSGAGVVLFGVSHAVGATLVVVSCGSMAAAALVLVTSDPSRARPAAIQGAPPLAALISLGIWALL